MPGEFPLPRTASNDKSKNLAPVSSLCNRAGTDAALVRTHFIFAGAPTIKNKIEQNIQNTQVASAKVALDTVREFCLDHGLSFGLQSQKHCARARRMSINYNGLRGLSEAQEKILLDNIC